jgi:hypothetical protein
VPDNLIAPERAPGDQVVGGYRDRFQALEAAGLSE